MNRKLTIKLTISCIIGGLAGYLILHPSSMFIHQYLIDHNILNFDFIWMSFSSSHVEMAIFFTIGGMIIGFFQGLYSFRINSLYEKVFKLSNTDELTSLYNRRYLMNELVKEIERSKRYSRGFTLIIADIDKFKCNNDSYGHIYGDEILKLVARFFLETFRKTDIVARYGGDEFVIIMPETEKNTANITMKRILKKLNQYRYENQKHSLKTNVMISFGIASFPSDAKDIDELIHNADLALYKAKELGGNKSINFNLNIKKIPLDV